MLIKKIVKFFDKLEDKIRGKLSHYPIIYAFIGGVGIILFWRGVWHTADDINLGSLLSLFIGASILIIIGLFVTEFIGNRLIISGLIGEEKLAEKETGEIKKEEKEIQTEEMQLKNLKDTLDKVEQKVSHLEEDMHRK